MNGNSRQRRGGTESALTWLVIAIIGAAGFVPSCAVRPPRPSDPYECPTVPEGELPAPTPRALSGSSIQNLLQVSGGIYSGGEPRGDADYSELERLGVKTIVSVDGARPDVESARARGLRYVHIPIGYDGIDRRAARALTRLVRDAEAPFYIHCHHGTNRAPAAAAVAGVASGDLETHDTLDVLELAGTSREYLGLWRDVEGFRPLDASEELPDLVEVAPVDSVAAAMAQVDRAFEHLKLSRRAGWERPSEHPDIAPAHEALLLREGFHEAVRALTGRGDAAQLREWLVEAEDASRRLVESIEKGDGAAATTELERLRRSCGRCHDEYRDRS